MVSFSEILSGRELIGLSEGYSVSELVKILGNPDMVDEFTETNERLYYYNDLNVVTDPEERTILAIGIYVKCKSGKFILPDIITSTNFIKKDSNLDEVSRIFSQNNIKCNIIEKAGDKHMELLNGNIIFVECEDGLYYMYSIHFKKI